MVYPGVFYTAEDFAAGNVDKEGITSSAEGDFCTIRMVLLLSPNEVYAISAKSVSYAQRMFVDGREIRAVGYPSVGEGSFISGNRCYMAGVYAGKERAGCIGEQPPNTNIIAVTIIGRIISGVH